MRTVLINRNEVHDDFRRWIDLTNVLLLVQNYPKIVQGADTRKCRTFAVWTILYYEKYFLLACDAFQSSKSPSTLWTNVLAPSSMSKNRLSKQDTSSKVLISCWQGLFYEPEGDSSYFRNIRTVRRYIPEGGTLCGFRCENLKSNFLCYSERWTSNINVRK
jgi:hypothetical protein